MLLLHLISLYNFVLKYKDMKKLKGKNVLITGGASGIGKIIARKMLENMANVIIWDINKSNISDTIKEYSNLGNIYGYYVDISNIDEVKKSADEVKIEIGIIDILINNAGIVVGKYFIDHSVAEIQRVMNVNTNAPMYVTLQFLDGMLTQNSGHICNIASSAGFITNPKMSVYAASKWAVIGWSDSLRLEMKQMKRNVKVTTIMPYYINTGMFDGVQSIIPILDPEKTATTIIRAIQKDVKMRSISRSLYFFARFGQALLPISAFDYIAGNILGIYKTMDNFVGRKK